MADEAIQRLGECTVLDPDGNEVRLGSFWVSKPVILAMVRHFG